MFTKGQRIVASDGMSSWDPATVIEGPTERLTSEEKLYLIEFDGNEYMGPSRFIAHEDEMRPIEEVEEV